MQRAKKPVEDFHRRNVKLLQQMDFLQDDYERAIEELLRNGKKRNGSSTIYLTPKFPTAMQSDTYHTLYQMLLVPPEVSAALTTAQFRKLSLLSHSDKGGDVKILKRLQQAHTERAGRTSKE